MDSNETFSAETFEDQPAALSVDVEADDEEEEEDHWRRFATSFWWWGWH
jgi:hypothetical protein